MTSNLPAVLEDPETPTEDTRIRKKRISAKLAKAIEHLVTAKRPRIDQAAKHAGMHRSALSHALRRPHVVAYARERALAVLDSSSVEAVAVLRRIMLFSTNDMAALKAAQDVLDRNKIGTDGPALGRGGIRFTFNF